MHLHDYVSMIGTWGSGSAVRVASVRGPTKMSEAFHLPLDAARGRIPPGPDDPQFVILRKRGSLTVEPYRPLEVDLQKPHSRDECYVIVEQTGIFEIDDKTVYFGPGDFLSVPAGMPHRFRDFGASMMTWVIFYGPDGGEDA